MIRLLSKVRVMREYAEDRSIVKNTCTPVDPMLQGTLWRS